MLSSATSKGEALGVLLIERLHNAVRASESWIANGALSIMYGNSGSVVVDGTKGCGTIGAVLVLMRAGLLGARWASEKPRVRYIPSLITVLVTGIVVRKDGRSARFMQTVRFRCKHRLWQVHMDRIVLASASAQCMHATVPTASCGDVCAHTGRTSSRLADEREPTGVEDGPSLEQGNAEEEELPVIPTKHRPRVTFKLLNVYTEEANNGSHSESHGSCSGKNGEKFLAFRFNVLGEGEER